MQPNDIWDEAALSLVGRDLVDGTWPWYQERITVKGWAEASGYRTLALAAMRAYADTCRDLAEAEQQVTRLREQLRTLVGVSNAEC
jgi:hypothetical protein